MIKTEMPTQLQLDYGQTKPAFYRRRLVILCCVLFVAFLSCSLLVHRYLLPWYEARQAHDTQLNWQTKCLSHEDPLTLVVCATDPKRLSNMQAPGESRWIGSDGASTFVSMPLEWDQEITYRMGKSPNHDIGNAMLHERHCPAGPSRLIAVDLTAGPQSIDLLCSVVIPGPAQLRNRARIQIPVLRKYFDVHDDFRVYTAQLDPTDSAAFTIPCTVTMMIHGKRQDFDETVDGRLNPDDTISLTPRIGFAEDYDGLQLKPDGREVPRVAKK